MGKIADQVLAYAANGIGYDVAFEEIRDLQVAAMNERFQEQADKIKLGNP